MYLELYYYRGDDTLKAIQITDSVYWVGAIDWSVRNFHGYETTRGTTYNAYLIIDEKITLIDTTKRQFTNELLKRISSVIEPSKIDYVICNHLEPDHAGAINLLMHECPNATVFVSSPHGEKSAPAFFDDFKFQGMKAGDKLNIGKRNLVFHPVPMLHWPDSMVTYCPEDQILYSNDAFGQHLATAERFDDEVDTDILTFEAKKYYANILMCYGRQAQNALKDLQDLPLKMILTGHGVSWRKDCKKIIDLYHQWSTFQSNPKKAVVVFDSMWHSTETMAKTITEAFASQGIHAKFYDLKVTNISDIVTSILDSEYLAVGSSTLNNMMLPNVAGFLCYLNGLAPKKHGRKALAFGSYGWGGQSIKQVQDQLESAGFVIWHDMIRVLNEPTPQVLDDIYNSLTAKLSAE